MNSQAHLSHIADLVGRHLDAWLPSADEPPQSLHAAMRYSVLAGGKRIRPCLCITSCEAVGGKPEQALAAACSIELLHTYTLIHDDLPAMDNDTLRRGRPTCHIAFDEATAILAGDALLTLSFEWLAVRAEPAAPLIAELARAAGSQGIIRGQIDDLAAEDLEPDPALLESIHRNKTASLIRAACVMGGLCAGAHPRDLDRLAVYGEQLGLAFQLVDDLLDESATVENLGKNIGSDKANGKMTWPSVHGIEKTREDARACCQRAVAALDGLPAPRHLADLAEFTLHRSC